MLKVDIPSKKAVYKMVENFQSYPHFQHGGVQNWLVHSLFTCFSQGGVDNRCGISVRRERKILLEQLFLQTQILKKS